MSANLIPPEHLKRITGRWASPSADDVVAGLRSAINNLRPKPSNERNQVRKVYFNIGAFVEIFARGMATGIRKNHDYASVGDGIGMTGVRGCVIRNLDKQLRALSLLEPGHEAAVKDESLKDTLLDQINYDLYAVALMEGKWNLQPENPERALAGLSELLGLVTGMELRPEQLLRALAAEARPLAGEWSEQARKILGLDKTFQGNPLDELPEKLPRALRAAVVEKGPPVVIHYQPDFPKAKKVAKKKKASRKRKR